MNDLMNISYMLMFAAVLAALALSIAGIVRSSLLAVGRWTAVAALALATAAVGVRWYVAGHPPIFGNFENSLALAWVALFIAIVAGFVSPRLVNVWRWAVPWALAALLFGSRFRSEPVPLTISEQSLWVEVHVVLAWIGFVSLLGATSLAVVRLSGRAPLGLPDAEADSLLGDLLMAGFCGLTGMLATGSWYLFILFDSFWDWSVVETLSLVAWLGYAIVIHGRLFYRWHGRRLDVSVLLVLPVLIAAYFIWSVFPGTWHFFEIPLVKPY